ncbi:flagellar FlbD family protein [Dethiothermospora halolimnae]|uniref:flagellar FlbD family protein n=1 Tax=Dethiothermospora halolimnae TaxID=3114390 RepID=UPI003CCBD376
MIEVSRINGKKVIINSELIETVESTPDTVITLTNGKKMVVEDTTDEIIRKVIKYKQETLTIDIKRRKSEV